MGRRFETDRAHLNLSVEIAFLIINCHLGHSSVTYLSLPRLTRGQDSAYRATLLYTLGMDTSATITCPLCNFSKMEIMPTDSCQFFYKCTNCHEVIKPNKQDCCVFCSYSDSKCPPKLEEILPA